MNHSYHKTSQYKTISQPHSLRWYRTIGTTFLYLFVCFVLNSQAATYFVKTDGDNLSDGTSWATALASVDTAITKSTADDEIWIAVGTYKQGVALKMKNDVGIYGGFGGEETEKSQRIVGKNETILDGNKTHRVFYNNFTADAPLTDTAILDSVTIANGYTSDFGGGMYNSFSSPTITNCTIRGNLASGNYSYGAGMFNYTSSNPTLTNCTISGNMATGKYSYGGGMANYTSSNPTLTNCTISGNSAAGSSSAGGGIRNYSANPTIINCTISGNAAYSGGGISNASSSPKVINCTISKNKASAGGGGGMANYSSGSKVTNSIFWGNTASTDAQISNNAGTIIVTYCIVQGEYVGKGNKSTTPLLMPLANYYGSNIKTMPVRIGSAAIAVGATQVQAPSGMIIPTTDAIGQVRDTTAACTIGAVEYFAWPTIGTFTGVMSDADDNIAGTWKVTTSKGGKVTAQVVSVNPSTGKLVKISFQTTDWESSNAKTGIYTVFLARLDQSIPPVLSHTLEIAVDLSLPWNSLNAEGLFTCTGGLPPALFLSGQRNSFIDKFDPNLPLPAPQLFLNKYLGDWVAFYDAVQGAWTIAKRKLTKGEVPSVKYLSFKISKGGAIKYAGKIPVVGGKPKSFSGSSTLLNAEDDAFMPVFNAIKGSLVPEADLIALPQL